MPHPPPSRLTVHALRGLVLGTSCSLALLAEERRRRTDLAWTIIDNGRFLKSQRCYHSGGLATIRARFTETGDYLPVPEEGWPRAEDVRREFVRCDDEWVVEKIRKDRERKEVEKVVEERRRERLGLVERLRGDLQRGSVPSSVLLRGLQEVCDERTETSELVEVMRQVEGVMMERGDPLAIARAYLILVASQKVEMGELMKRRPWDLISRLLETDNLYHLSVGQRPVYFEIAGSLLAYILPTLRQAHDQRYLRMLDRICRALILDTDGSLTRALLLSSSTHAKILSEDLTLRTSRLPLEESALFARNLARCADLAALKAPKIWSPLVGKRWLTVRHLLDDMKRMLAEGRPDLAIACFEGHVQNGFPRNRGCLSMAVQAADGTEGDFTEGAMRVLRVARRAGYDITGELERGISRRMDVLENAVLRTDSGGLGVMKEHLETLWSDLDDLSECVSRNSHNRIIRGCLRTRDYLSAIHLTYLQITPTNPLLSDPRVLSNLIFALSATREYHLLTGLLNLIHTPDPLVRTALHRARKRTMTFAAMTSSPTLRTAILSGLSAMDEVSSRWSGEDDADRDSGIGLDDEGGREAETEDPFAALADAVQAEETSVVDIQTDEILFEPATEENFQPLLAQLVHKLAIPKEGGNPRI